jgi:phosphoserine phosphatase
MGIQSGYNCRDMSATTRSLYLIRHGATDANLRRPYVLQGRRSNLPLSELGRQQADSTSRILAQCPIQAVFSSPLRRAVETASIIAGPHRLEVQAIDGLIECDVGDWEGLSWNEIERLDPSYLAAFQADPATVPYAGGESFQQVQDRTIPAIDQLIRDSTGDIVVVTHNVVARVTIARAIEMATANSRRIHLDNAGISVLSIRNGKSRLLTVNSVLHLSGLLSTEY